MKRGLFVMIQIVALLLACWVEAGKLEWPDSRVATIAKGYIQSYNAQDVDVMREFAATHRTEKALAERSAQARAERRMGFFEQLGALEPVLITDHTANTITVTCHAKKVGMWMRMTVKLQEAAPHKLEVVEMAPTSPPDIESSVATEEIEWENLAQLLEIVRDRSGVPGLAAAIVDNGRVADTAVAGVRMVDSAQPVTLANRWHIGSITKSMTAQVVGAVVEAGAIRWSTSIGEVIDDIDMNEAYGDVTVDQLLHHRGGIKPWTMVDDADEKRLAAFSGSPTEQRGAFIAEVLREEPAGAVGEFEYSNAGYSVVAYMTERATGESWESLMQTHVFRNMKSAGFGWGATADRPDEPRGHFSENGKFRVQDFGEYELGAYMAPAGDVHMSIADLAAYARDHLIGLAGQDGPVSAETIRYLHTAGTEEKPTYACGWMIMESESGSVHAHGGSAGTMFAHVEIYPDSGRAIVIAMNVGTEGMSVSKRIVDLINQRWSEADPVTSAPR